MNPIIIAAAQGTKHAFMRTLSVICILAVIAFLVLGVKRILYPRATESYAQQVQAGGINYNIEIYNPEDTFFLGVKFWGLKFGISKPTVKKIREITEEVKKPIQPANQTKGVKK
jgi:hypothetical protein